MTGFDAARTGRSPLNWDVVVLRLSTDEGLTGHATALAARSGTVTQAYLHETIAPVVLGRDVCDREAIWNEMWNIDKKYALDPTRKYTVKEIAEMSSQQATNLAAALVASGAADAVLACGVESMSRIPLGANTQAGPGRAIPKSYFEQYEFTTQFEGAERIADEWGITRDDCDHFGFLVFLFGRVRNDDPSTNRFRLFDPAHQDTIMERAKLHMHLLSRCES